jgi:Family of unknown function (DUF6188)
VTIDVLERQTCTGVSERYPENFTFGFGPIYLAVDCLWCILVQERIAVTSRDHGHRFGHGDAVDACARAALLLQDRLVVSVRLEERSGDLIVEFTDGRSLQIFNDSSGYEPWNLTAPGIRIVALGGGGVVHFPTDDKS